jgi:hypothetical protein
VLLAPPWSWSERCFAVVGETTLLKENHFPFAGYDSRQPTRETTSNPRGTDSLPILGII